MRFKGWASDDSEPMTDALVVFTPSGKRGRFALGTPVLTAARQLGVDIDSVCGGRAICGRCQVTVGEGSFAKHGITSTAEHLTAFSAVEQRYQGRKGLPAGRRLSCQAQLLGDIVIDVPADSQVHKQVVRKRAEVRAIELDTTTRLHYVEVEEPDMHRQRGDFERVEEALQAQWGLGELTIDLGPLRALQKALRKGEWKITVAVHKGERIIACWPGFHDTLLGIAVDIGSTTIAAHLCDMATGEVLASSGMMNPQIRFGEDLMSRVSYAMMNPGGEAEMTAAVRTALDALVGELCAEAKADPQDVLELVFVGNPIMHHLLLGIDPVELGGAPFALATDSALELLAPELDLHSVNPGCPGLRPALHRRAMSAPTAPAWCCPRRPGSTRRSRSWSMSAPMPRSSWATRTSCSPAPRRPGRPSRVRRSATASARRRAPSSGCGSTGTRWSRASR